MQSRRAHLFLLIKRRTAVPCIRFSLNRQKEIFSVPRKHRTALIEFEKAEEYTITQVSQVTVGTSRNVKLHSSLFFTRKCNPVVRVLQAHLVKEWWAKWAVKYIVLCSSWGKDTESPNADLRHSRSKMAAFTSVSMATVPLCAFTFPAKNRNEGRLARIQNKTLPR
ncbi:hypothetical protein CDAR_61461 [Caerostris darwini]|uniref:Uncharacterized protein n=1 Tax=Caerostris darwini TaxID=1538125 RepID=A0AAV4UJ95_9ARAC|nr:hypothetical protein CDAR_61461 [Caerostris darwini]